MDNYNIYRDIASRTNGDIYVGVVGPVRTGKSTFIAKVMESLVLPNIQDANVRDRAKDEMPQSGDGKLIMTTQPKFVPNEAVKVDMGGVLFNMRMIDCVGYMVEGAQGNQEDGKTRMVVTPWSDQEMPFEEAAEIGTNKVITNHSTVAVLITTDGSITDIDRTNYVVAEERVVKELKNCNKPFVVLLNTTHPNSPETTNLAKSLSEKYKAAVLPIEIQNIEVSEINSVFAQLLAEFPITKIGIKMPQWMQILDFDSEIMHEIIGVIRKTIQDLEKINEVPDTITIPEMAENFEPNLGKIVDLGTGKVTLIINPKPDLYYRVLSQQCNCDIKNEYHLISYIKQLSVAKTQYDKFKEAIEQVKETGYGIVRPELADMVLEEPQLYKAGGKYGVKLKANAPSLHIMQVDIETEVNSMVGNEHQTQELLQYLNNEFNNNPNDIWETKMFGRSLYTLVNDGMQSKLTIMPPEIQKKMRRTLGRIVNEGKGGMICILL